MTRSKPYFDPSSHDLRSFATRRRGFGERSLPDRFIVRVWYLSQPRRKLTRGRVIRLFQLVMFTAGTLTVI